MGIFRNSRRNKLSLYRPEDTAPESTVNNRMESCYAGRYENNATNDSKNESRLRETQCSTLEDA